MDQLDEALMTMDSTVVRTHVRSITKLLLESEKEAQFVLTDRNFWKKEALDLRERLEKLHKQDEMLVKELDIMTRKFEAARGANETLSRQVMAVQAQLMLQTGPRGKKVDDDPPAYSE